MFLSPVSHLGSERTAEGKTGGITCRRRHPLLARHLSRNVDAAAGTLNRSRLLRRNDAIVILVFSYLLLLRRSPIQEQMSVASMLSAHARTRTDTGRVEGCSVVSDFQLIHKHKGALCGPMTTLIHSLSQFLSCQPSQIPPTSSEQLSSTADECIKCSFRRKRFPLHDCRASDGGNQ